MAFAQSISHFYSDVENINILHFKSQLILASTCDIILCVQLKL